jgi:hypothetical protein
MAVIETPVATVDVTVVMDMAVVMDVITMSVVSATMSAVIRASVATTVSAAVSATVPAAVMAVVSSKAAGNEQHQRSCDAANHELFHFLDLCVGTRGVWPTFLLASRLYRSGCARPVNITKTSAKQRKNAHFPV